MIHKLKLHDLKAKPYSCDRDPSDKSYTYHNPVLRGYKLNITCMLKEYVLTVLIAKFTINVQNKHALYQYTSW